jgi:hypothetical protein
MLHPLQNFEVSLLYPEIKVYSAKFRKQREGNLRIKGGRTAGEKAKTTGEENPPPPPPPKKKSYLVISSTKRCMPVIEHSKFNRDNVPCTSLDSLPKLLDFFAKIKIPG